MLCDFYNESLAYQENQLTQQYLAMGHEVTVIASTFDNLFDFVNDRYDPAWPERTYRVNDAKIIKLRYRTNFLNRVRTYRPLGPLFAQERPDLIFVHDIHLNLPDAVAYARQHPEVRLILDYHADYSNSGKNWLSLRLLHGVIRKRALDRARPVLERIYPVVPASARFLHEVYGVPHHEMEILPLGADLALSCEVAAAGAGRTLRTRHGIPEGAFVVFTGGKLTPAKRTEVLLYAMRNLDDLGAWLVVVGEGASPDDDYCRRLREAAADLPRVLFTGWQDTQGLLGYLDMADVAVFPASQSVLWQQAIGMGKPLVIADTRALPGGDQDVSYLNLHGNIVITEGRLAPEQFITEQLRELATHRERCSSMAQGARQVAEEMLDWRAIAERTLQPRQHAV